jgi:ABC-type spermidine/putrescine transport system permease subunit II
MSDQNFGQPPLYPQTSSLAVISLISGIASYFVVPMLGAIAAIITSNMAKKEIKESAGQLTGEGLAQAGMILGWINIGLTTIGFFITMLVVFGVISIAICGITATLPFWLLPFAY